MGCIHKKFHQKRRKGSKVMSEKLYLPPIYAVKLVIFEAIISKSASGCKNELYYIKLNTFCTSEKNYSLLTETKKLSHF